MVMAGLRVWDLGFTVSGVSDVSPQEMIHEGDHRRLPKDE